MSAADLLALAERVEQATGADRELDAAIERALGMTRKNALKREVFGNGSRLYPKRFTASLDAALTLVPEGWDWAAGTAGAAKGGHALLEPDRMGRETETDAATPALALCAAALRARAAQESGK